MKKVIFFFAILFATATVSAQTVYLKVNGVATPMDANQQVVIKGQTMTAAQAVAIQNSGQQTLGNDYGMVTLTVGGVDKQFPATEIVTINGKNMTAAEAAEVQKANKSGNTTTNWFGVMGVGASFNQNGGFAVNPTFRLGNTPVSLSYQGSLPGTYAQMDNRNWRNAVMQQNQYNRNYNYNNQYNYGNQNQNYTNYYNNLAMGVNNNQNQHVNYDQTPGYYKDGMGRVYYWNGQKRIY